MSLNLAQAWKGIPPPPPDVASPQPVASNGAPGQPDGEGKAPQAPPGGVSPALPPTAQGAVLSGQQPASSAPPQTEEPPRLRSLFEHPLVLPPSDAAWKPDPVRLQQLAALVLHRHKDPELDDILAKNPAWHAQTSLDDGSMPARAMLGQQIAREILGESHANEPGLYFLSVGEKLPQSATRQEAYAAICDHYTREAEQRYVDNKNRRAAWQANRAALEKLIPQVVSGLKTPEELTAELTPAQLIVYNREFDPAAVGKAHAAFQLLRQAFSATPEEGLRSMIDQGLSRRITSCLSDTAQDGSAVLNETALELFEVSLKNLMADVQEQSGDQYKFLHNARLALFSPLRKRGDDIRLLDATHQAAEQAGTAAIAAGMMEAIGWESGKQNAEARMEMKTGELASLREEWLRHRAADKQETRVLGLLSQGQDLGNQPNDRASFTSRTVNCLGSVVGQTMPFFVPGAGWGVALAGAFDDKRNRAYYAGLEPGTAEWSAFIDAAASTAVEKISFGAIGKFSGAGWLINKLPVANKLRRTLSDALWQRVLFETGAGIVEETVAEPTAEAIIQWVVRNNLAPLVKLDAGGKYDWNNYWQELRGMLSPDQLMATALFVGGLSGMQSPSIRRSLITYSKNAEMLMTQGIPKEEAQRIVSIENASERIAAARQARGKAWENSDQAVKNAREGMAAFRHLGEVQATIESEAYKYFQKQYNLPTVEEKLDAPGTYAVTVYDRDSGGKKFTQDMTGDQLVALFGRYFSRAEQEEVRKTQSEFAANAFLRSAEATGELQTQDMLQWGREHRENGHPSPSARTSSPASASTAASGQGPPTSSIVPRTSSIVPQESSVSALGGFIRTFGAMSQQAFSHLARLAAQEYARRTSSGMPEPEAASAPFSALSPYVPLGSLMELDKAFAHRLDIAKKTTGEEGLAATRLFRMSTAPGTTPADTLFLLTRGSVGSRELLEDLFEWKLGKMVLKDPSRLQAVASLLRDTQASMQKLGFKGQFVEPRGELSDMQIVEAMSKLALSDMLSNADSLPLPQWQKDLLQYHVNTLGDAAYLLHIGQAYNAGRRAGVITQDMADILRDLGHEVHAVFDTAKIEQEDIQAVMDARAILASRDPSGAPTASQIRERQRRDAQEEKNRVTTGDRSKQAALPQESLQHPESVPLPEAPSSMQGVFANGASWNPDAGTWLGMVPVDKLHLSPEVPQVKVNSGKKGVVNPLVGDYRADAPPIYVWMRANGRLEVVSGRHRLDLAQRTGTKNIPAYVYEEDAAHDAKWARLLDYEQNMQDDQADELTAAIYVRETGLTDAELTRRGLTRSGTKSRRGLLIGREARQELWSRFKSGLIKAQDAEAICLLTQHIQDKTRIDAIQAQAAADLAKGKSLDFAAAKIQLMIHAPQDGGMVQGLISFGASFDEALERSAEYVARCIAVINEHIGAIKGVRTIAKKGTVMEAEGITAGLSADPAQRLRELELLKAMYEKIGLYENLRFRALAWDGKTPPDPIGDHRLDMLAEQARAQEEAAARQEEENRKASEALTPGLGFSLTSLHDIVSGLAAPSMQATRAADLVKDFGKAAENWRRVMSGKEEQPAAPVGAELYGMVSSLISSARLVLPPGYRSRVDLQMQWASVYAAMAESGQIPPKGSLRSGDAFYERFVTAMVNNTLAAASAEDARQILASIGSRRLDRVMSSVLDRVRDQLAYFAKDELYEKTMRRVEAVYPKKQPGKKSPRGRLEAQAYRLLARYRSMLASTPEVKAQAMASLNALHNGEPDADKRREYEEDLLAWKTYGDYAGMSLPQAQAAMKQLLEFVMTGRSAWAAKLRQERGRAKYAARQIGQRLPAANNASSRAGSKIAYRTRLRKCLASLPYGFMSYSHLMLALEPVLGQRFSRERIREIAEANTALLNASNDRAAWLSAAIRRITGATSESAAEQWLVEFNTPQETGIILKPAITVRITLPVEEARDWLALTKDERAARRKEIRKNDAISETLTENVPEEEDIPLLRQALDDYESRTPDQQQYQRFLTTEREIEGEENAFPLTCSRDCALYAILLHEQEDYADKYDADGKLIRKGFLRREGFDEAAMAALYEFVGPAGLAYGYALREKLNETGRTLAHVYEERMGVPFALKENYFRATFDRNSTREKDTLAEPQGGAIAAGKYGSLIERVPHAENLDFSRAASLVFLAAAAEQDNYIHTSHITAFWRSLLLDKRLEQKLRQNLGEDLMGKLASWLDLIDGASLENNRAFLHLSRMQGMLQRAFAFSVLAGNGYVLLKQSTAILHGFFAGWAPSGVLERADGSHELAHRPSPSPPSSYTWPPPTWASGKSA